MILGNWNEWNVNESLSIAGDCDHYATTTEDVYFNCLFKNAE